MHASARFARRKPKKTTRRRHFSSQIAESPVPRSAVSPLARPGVVPPAPVAREWSDRPEGGPVSEEPPKGLAANQAVAGETEAVVGPLLGEVRRLRSSRIRNAAAMNERKSGAADCGFDLNSGWN
jgi:hypothetical protein